MHFRPTHYCDSFVLLCTLSTKLGGENCARIVVYHNLSREIKIKLLVPERPWTLCLYVCHEPWRSKACMPNFSSAATQDKANLASRYWLKTLHMDLPTTFILLLVDFYQPVKQLELEDLRCPTFCFHQATFRNRKHEEVLTFSIWLKCENNRISRFRPCGLMSEAFKGEQQQCPDKWMAKLPFIGSENFVT